MPKRIDNVTRDYLVNAELPLATKSYTVISHEFVINTIKEKLADKGFNIINETYRSTDEAKVATGVFQLQYNEDPDLGLIFAFANSYDKSLKFRCAVGGYVKTNQASIIASDSSSWTRKHTGTADSETVETIEDLIEDAFDYFDDLKNSKERMKNITISKEDFSKLVGVLFLDLGVINTEQISLIKQELDKPSYQYTTADDSLWTRYNHILVALKKSHPKYWMEQQKLVHLHLTMQLDSMEFNQRPDDAIANIPVKDPNQIDMLDVIAEVEEKQSVIKMEDIALTPDELAEQLYGVNNNEEAITMKAYVETDEECNARVAEIEGEPEIDLDKEEDDDWDQLEAAGVITKSGSDFDIDNVQSEEEPVFKLPVAPVLHEEMREMDQAIKDDSDNIGQLNESSMVIINPDLCQEVDTDIYNYHRETEDTSDDLAVEIEESEPSVESIQNGEFFISELELGMSPEVGETITLGDDYFYVDRKTELNGVPGYTLVGFIEEQEEVTQLSHDEIVKQIAEDEAAVAKVCDEPSVQEEPVEESEPEELDEFEITDAPERRSINVLNNTPSNETATHVEQEEEITSASEQFDELIAKKEEDRVRQIISQELYDLYGSLQKFEYTVELDQYNVTLDTGETIVIPFDLLDA